MPNSTKAKFTQTQFNAAVAEAVKLTLAQLQVGAQVPAPQVEAPVVVATPKPSLRQRKRKVNAAKLAAAKQARAERQAAGLALVTKLAQSKEQIGRCYPTPAAIEDLGYLLPAGATECVLASTGNLFVYGPKRVELLRFALPADHAALVRAAYAATTVRKAPTAR